MAYIVDVRDGMTPRELLAELTRAFGDSLDTPLSFVEMHYCDGCDPEDVATIKVHHGQGLELKFYAAAPNDGLSGGEPKAKPSRLNP